jgi:PAS domain S-box-containing protein
MRKTGDEHTSPDPDDLLSPAFQTVFDAIPTGLLIVDPMGKLAVVNSAAEHLFMLSRNEWKGLGLDALVPDAPKSQQSPRQLRAVRTDRAEIQVEFVSSSLSTREGDWGIVSIVELPRAMQVDSGAREDRGHFKAYWEAASEGLVTVDASGTIETVNHAIERIFGYVRSELLGQTLEILIPESLRDAHAGKVKQFLANPRLRPMGIGLSLFGRKKDGTQFPVEVGLSAAYLGERTVAIAFISDITEKRRLQEHTSVLGAMVDLQQQLSASAVFSTQVTAADVDPLTSLGTATAFNQALAAAISDPRGLYCVVYSLLRLRQIDSRYGGKTANRLVIFVSQFIANSLLGDRDQLFRWDNTSFVGLLRRDSTPKQVKDEVNDACGKRLEYAIGRADSNGLVLVELQTTVLTLTQLSLADTSKEIERLAAVEL